MQEGIKECMFEKEYWHQVDPDGRRRDLTWERMRKLEDLKEELNFINAQKSGCVLDYGCGLGFALSGMSLRHRRYAYDISDYAIQKTLELNPGVEIIKDIQQVRFDDFFDIILCYHVIEHLDVLDGRKLLLEFQRLLRPGGVLILGTPRRQSVVHRKWGNKYRLLHDTTHQYLWSLDELVSTLEQICIFPFQISFPFRGTRYDTDKNNQRALGMPDKDWSPSWFGNIMTIYAEKRTKFGIGD